MIEARSAKDVMKDGTIYEVATSIEKDYEEAMETLEVSLGDLPDKLIAFKVTGGGAKQLRTIARGWRVSVSALVRICIHKAALEYGYDCGEILYPKDIVALNRSDAAPKKPFTHRDAARRVTAPVFASAEEDCEE